MSYDILYDFQFIRSSDGITAVLLLGANNCYESVWCGNHVGQKRARSWCCLFNEPALDDAEFMKQVQSMTGNASTYHWMRRGQWVDDKALLRWAKRGLKNAADIESVIAANTPSSAIACSLVVWNGSVRDVVLKEYVSTTEQYDDWIRRAKALRTQWSGRPNLSIFFTIELWDGMNHPISTTQGAEQKVCIMKRKRYLKEYTDRTCIWVNCIKDAIQFSVSEAQQAISCSSLMSGATIVKAPKETDLYDTVIQFEYGTRKEYVADVTPRAIRPCFDIKNAWRYRDERTAQRAIEKLSKRAPHLNFSIQHLA